MVHSQLANPPNHIHMRSVDSLLLHTAKLKYCFVTSLVVYSHSTNPPTHTLIKYRFITSLVVHGHSANPPTCTLIKYCFVTSLVVHSCSTNPPTRTLRGSAYSIILSIRLPTHLYVRKMWCSSFRTKLFLFSPDGNYFVNKSASFSWVLT